MWILAKGFALLNDLSDRQEAYGESDLKLFHTHTDKHFDQVKMINPRSACFI